MPARSPDRPRRRRAGAFPCAHAPAEDDLLVLANDDLDCPLCVAEQAERERAAAEAQRRAAAEDARERAAVAAAIEAARAARAAHAAVIERAAAEGWAGAVTREERAARVASLRAEGLVAREIARALGISRSYADALARDPTGEIDRARKERQRRRCPDCGALAAWGATRCMACYRASVEAPCGTLSAYKRGCRCDGCREANAAWTRAYYRRRAAAGNPLPRRPVKPRPRPRPDAERRSRLDILIGDLITTPQAGRLLGVGDQRVRDFIADGRLPVAVRVAGRILLMRADVEELARKRAASPPKPGPLPTRHTRMAA